MYFIVYKRQVKCPLNVKTGNVSYINLVFGTQFSLTVMPYSFTQQTEKLLYLYERFCTMEIYIQFILKLNLVWLVSWFWIYYMNDSILFVIN